MHQWLHTLSMCLSLIAPCFLIATKLEALSCSDKTTHRILAQNSPSNVQFCCMCSLSTCDRDIFFHQIVASSSHAIITCLLLLFAMQFSIVKYTHHRSSTVDVYAHDLRASSDPMTIFLGSSFQLHVISCGTRYETSFMHEQAQPRCVWRTRNDKEQKTTLIKYRNKNKAKQHTNRESQSNQNRTENYHKNNFCVVFFSNIYYTHFIGRGDRKRIPV